MKNIHLLMITLISGFAFHVEAFGASNWCKEPNNDLVRIEGTNCPEGSELLSQAQTACVNRALPGDAQAIIIMGAMYLAASIEQNGETVKCSELAGDAIADNNNGVEREDVTPSAQNVFCRNADGTFNQHAVGDPVQGCTDVTDTNLISCFQDSLRGANPDPMSDCAEQITAAYRPQPDSNSGIVTVSGAASKTGLEWIACDGSIRTTQRENVGTSERTVWSQVPNSANDVLIAKMQSARNRSSRSSGTNVETDFMQAHTLTTCEDNATKRWSEFSKELTGASARGGVDDLWKPSFYYTLKRMYPLDGNNSQILLNGTSDFSAEEISFIKECAETPQASVITVISTAMDTQTSNPQAGKEDREKSLSDLKAKVGKVIHNGIAELFEHRKEIEKCEALPYLVTEDNTDFNREYEASSSSRGKTVKLSFDQKIKCETYGPEAQDFKKCSSFINTYDGALVAKTALNSGQQIHYQGQSMDRQAELGRQGSTGGIDHRGALGSQKEDIKDRAGYATQNAALDSAKLATLLAILQSMPTKGKLISKCEASFSGAVVANAAKRINSAHKEALDLFLKPFGLKSEDSGLRNLLEEQNAGSLVSDTLPAADSANSKMVLTSVDGTGDGSSLCSITATNRSDTLIMNAQMRSVAKQVIAQTTIEAAANFAAAGMLNKQARQIDDLLKRIEGYDPSEDFIAPTADLMAGPCAFDPTQEGCAAEFSGADRSVGFGDTSLSFSAGGSGNSGTQLGADEGYDNATGLGNGDADRSGAATTVGSIIPTVDKKSGFQDPAAAAARVKSGAAPRSGGGGGGGASAVGSTGNGGGGGSTGQARGGQANGGKQLAYAGSSIGRLSGGRGVARKPAAKDGAANPFANMFKKGAPNNETLNFRNPAGIGNKGGNIFDQISSRYQVVQTKNRLLEYEEKKK